MIQEVHRETAFSEVEEERLPEVARLSRSAVLSLAFGLLSSGTLLSPAGGLFAFAAVVLALIALRSIARAESPLWGRKAAMTGLALGVLFATWGVTRHVLHDRLVTEQARQSADRWLQMLRGGQVYEAHQLMLSRNVRQPPEKSLAEHYAADEEAALDLKEFQREPPVRRVLDADPSARIDYRGVTSREVFRTPGVREDIVTLRYVLRGAGSPPAEDVPFDLTLIRTRAKAEDEAEWRVDGLRRPKAGVP